MNFRKNSKGITLVALVVTIIVLLILAGVSLSLIMGNDGILGRAENAVTEHTNASIEEEIELAIAELKMAFYDDMYVNGGKYEDGSAIVSFAEYAGKKLSGTGMQTSKGTITVSDGNIMYASDDVTSTKVGTFDEVTGDVSVNVESTAGTGNKVTIPDDLGVGDTVTYSPSGSYTWDAEYATSDDSIADVALKTGSGTGTQDMSITSWKVLSVDESTGKVELVPTAATTGKVTLQGAQGYNNGVKLLNDACSELYGNSSKGITARSINRDDVESLMNVDFVDYYQTNYPFSDLGMEENYRDVNAYAENKKYPVIYSREELSIITKAGDNQETKIELGEGLGRSEQDDFISRTEEGATDGIISTATSIRPCGITPRFVNTSTLFEEENKSLLLSENKGYWLASRTILPDWSRCQFIVMNMWNCNFGGGESTLYNSTGDSYSKSNALFPIVSLSANLLSGEDGTNWAVN